MTFGSAQGGPSEPGDGVKPAADYDRFVDWPKRLAREAPFFRREFQAHDVRRVIDVGAGSAMHASMWAEWGLDVVAVDPDPAMLAQARHNVDEARNAIDAAGGSLEILEGGFGELASLGLNDADAVTCTGNALPHINGQDELVPTLKDFASVLKPGGLVVLQLLNHDRLISGRIRVIPPKVRDDQEGTWVFLRLTDYVEGGIRFDFITLHRPEGAWESEQPWETTSRRSVHTALPASALVSGLEAAGFRDVSLYGNHDGSPLRLDDDESVIVTAVKA